MTEVTQILCAIAQGDPSAADQFLPLVYEELRQLAARKLADETPGQTLQATALVHEALGTSWMSKLDSRCFSLRISSLLLFRTPEPGNRVGKKIRINMSGWVVCLARIDFQWKCT
jgi:hypothetical protein